MRFYITDQCNNCMDCVGACPKRAIRPAGSSYLITGEEAAPLSYYTPYIVQEKCDGCVQNISPLCVQSCSPNAIFINMLE